MPSARRPRLIATTASFPLPWLFLLLSHFPSSLSSSAIVRQRRHVPISPRVRRPPLSLPAQAPRFVAHPTTLLPSADAAPCRRTCLTPALSGRPLVLSSPVLLRRSPPGRQTPRAKVTTTSLPTGSQPLFNSPGLADPPSLLTMLPSPSEERTPRHCSRRPTLPQL